MLGVLLASLVEIGPLVCVLIILVALVAYFAERHLFVLVFLVCFALGALRFDIKDFHELQPAGDRGIVVSEPEYRESDVRFVVKTNTGEKVLLSANLLTQVRYGDEVEITGKAQAPKPAEYAKYLSKDDIYYVMNYAKVVKISEGHGSFIIASLLRVKSSFVDHIKQIFSDPESSLLAGLIVAGKQALPKSITDEFERAGVVHVVVLSGYNLTIIAEFLLAALAFLGKRRSAIVSALAIVLFTLMTGAAATIVRAAIMVLALLLGKIINRPGSAGRILLVTAVLMLIHNPKELVFDPSFQLTFSAMLALIYVVPIFEKYIPNKIISTTLGVQLVVFPYILYNMGNFSTVFLLSNLLILLVVPYTMLLGFLVTCISYLLPTTFSLLLAFPTHLLLKWILFVSHNLGNLSWANIQIQNFPLWLTLLIYLIIVGIVTSIYRGINLKEKARELLSRPSPTLF